MKTTIDLDEAKLQSVMKLKDFKTRKEAIDYALCEAERLAKLDALRHRPFYVCEGPVIDPAYDLRAVRDSEKALYVRSRR